MTRLGVRAVVLALAASAGMAGCGAGRALQTPTVEYITAIPSPTNTATPTATETPTNVPTVMATATPTPVPIVRPSDAGDTTGQGDGSSLLPVRPVVGDGDGAGLTYAGQCGWGYSATVTRWWPVITQYDWDACTALSIIKRESGGQNIYNYAGSGACGVMQLDPCEYPSDGAANIARGYEKYQAAGGWSPWAVSP